MTMVEAPVHPGVQFLTEMFRASTKAPVYVCSFPNADAVDREAPERRIIDRDPEGIGRFIQKWDRPDRGIYFGVNTVTAGSSSRKKENIAEINCLHADIDFDKVKDSEAEIITKLSELKHIPSRVVHSGNGFHCYWLFQEAIEATDESKERIEGLLRLLADHVGGDLATCDVSRVLRLPGTHNTKNGEWKEVKVLIDRPIRYAWLDELEEWLETSRPVIFRKPKANGANGHDHLNPFEAVAAQFAGKPPVDVEKTLAEMAVGNIHASQLSVTAALLNRGHDLEEVLGIVLDATKAAAGDYAKRWNWRREEKTVRGMCQDWIKKHPEIVEKIEPGQEIVKHTIWPDWDKKAKRPSATFANAIVAILDLQIVCRKDVFHEQFVISGELIDQWGPQLSDEVVIILRTLIKARFGFDPNEKNTRDAAVFLCLQNQFDPVVEYLSGLIWDGVPRIDRWLITYLGAEDTELNREFGRLFLIAAVRRARSPGCKFDQILILEGKQGAGKSTAIKILAGEENFSDQHILAVSDREQQEAFRGVWIHEIAELSGMGRAEIEKIKSFASRTEDRARPAYGRIRVDMKRRGVFMASTNKESYLKDDTGNRRFWPLRVGKVDLEAIARDRDQLWAEAAKIEAQGESMRLHETLWGKAEIEQEARSEEDVWQTAVETYVINSGKVQLIDVITGALQIEKGRVGQIEQNRVARILRRLGYVRKRESSDGRPWVYVREEKPKSVPVSPEACPSTKSETGSEACPSVPVSQSEEELW